MVRVFLTILHMGLLEDLRGVVDQRNAFRLPTGAKENPRMPHPSLGAVQSEARRGIAGFVGVALLAGSIFAQDCNSAEAGQSAEPASEEAGR